MTKPMFQYSLFPEGITAAAFANVLAARAVFFLANALVYSTLFFLLVTPCSGRTSELPSTFCDC
jgi:hypothetical protein